MDSLKSVYPGEYEKDKKNWGDLGRVWKKKALIVGCVVVWC